MLVTDYRKVIVLNFWGMGNTVFLLGQKIDGKKIFTDS